MNALTIMRKDEQAELATIGADQLQAWIMEFFVIKMATKSVHTKRAYLADLQILARRTNGDLSDASLMKFASWIQGQGTRGAGYSPRTSNRVLSVCRKFMRFLMAAGYVQRNYLDLVEGTSIDKNDGPYVALTDSEVRMMLAAPDRTTLAGSSAYLALMMGYHMGLRRSEMAQVRVLDVAFTIEGATLRVRGKGNRVRIVALSEEMLRAVREHMVLMGAHALAGVENVHLLVSRESHGAQVGTNSIWRWFQDAAISAGIDPDRVCPHGARATMITKALDAGVGIRDVANMAGHRSIETTSIYDKRRDTSAETVKRIKY